MGQCRLFMYMKRNGISDLNILKRIEKAVFSHKYYFIKAVVLNQCIKFFFNDIFMFIRPLNIFFIQW